MKVYHIVFYLILFLGIPSVILGQKKISAEEYINIYKDLAISEMKRSGIPASITLAQGMLESANGNSRLATKANNHFGIKCHGWEGQEIYHDDNKKGECFRHYKSAEESYLDHTDFLMTRSRYAFLFEYKSTDYKSWAKGLRKAGYATDPNYPQLLINLIERYDLHQYDTGVSVAKKPATKPTQTSKPSKGKKSGDDFSISINPYDIAEINGTEYVIAKNDDSFESITKNMHMMPWQLAKYNELPANSVLKDGQIIFLQPKKRKAEKGKENHVVQQGETMYSISQKYAIRLKRLYVLNRMEEGTEPEAGTKLNLRKKKK